MHYNLQIYLRAHHLNSKTYFFPGGGPPNPHQQEGVNPRPHPPPGVRNISLGLATPLILPSIQWVNKVPWRLIQIHAFVEFPAAK